MPTYEYLCQTCSHRFETWQKMTDEPLTVCPECGNHIRRVLFPAGVVFKGSGFYSTDYSHKNSSLPADTKTESSSSESKTSSESATAGSKPAESSSNSSSSTATPA